MHLTYLISEPLWLYVSSPELDVMFHASAGQRMMSHFECKYVSLGMGIG